MTASSKTPRTTKTPATVRKRPQQERSKSTVDVILATAAQLMAREGYAKVSTNRIAQVAGVSVGSLYQYFPSKDAIVAELFEHEVDSGFDNLEKRMAVASELSLEAIFDTLLVNAPPPFGGNMDLARVVFEQIPAIGKVGRVGDIRRRFTDVMIPPLTRRKADLRTDLSIETLAFYVAQTCMGIQSGLLFADPATIDRQALLTAHAHGLVKFLKPQR